jgi:4-hydroxy-4-methyl-2-oxoglutarate aldolase
MVGRARTAAFMEVYHHEPGTNPYELEIALIDSLKQDEIPVFACSNPARVAPWGELLSTAAKARGAAGALMDGCTRDVRAIRAMGFPVFHGGIGPLDSKGRGRIMAIDVPIECAGVPIASGDLIFGDADGVVVIPKTIEVKVLELAFEKVTGEHNTLRDLQRGDKLADVFARYGIL